jgi:CheY-like chemotaxis protein
MSRIRVLIVDDQENARRTLRRLLEAEPGFQICGEASDGLEAIQRAAELAPDVVLMDLAMPHMGGLAATRQIVEESPGVEVLIVSAYRTPELVVQAQEAGASGYLSKAMIDRSIVEAVEVLGRHQYYFSLGDPPPVESPPDPGGQEQETESRSGAVIATVTPIRLAHVRSSRHEPAGVARGLRAVELALTLPAQDERGLLREFARRTREEVGYPIVWLGQPAVGDAETLATVAEAGFGSEGASAPEVPAAEERGFSPVSIVLQVRQPVVVTGLSAEPSLRPWLTPFLREGCQAIALLPLEWSGVLYGVLALFSDDAGPFSQRELDLLGLASGSLAARMALLRACAEAGLEPGRIGSGFGPSSWKARADAGGDSRVGRW